MNNKVINKRKLAKIIKLPTVCLFLLLPFILGGCSNGAQDLVVKLPEPNFKNVADALEKLAADYYPLTGYERTEKKENRSLAVVVSNHPDARPQTGLSQADFVFEYLVEGNITRFLALFHSEKPEKIGPVRSARPYFIETAKGYGSFFVAHGYSDTAEKLLKDGIIDNINGMQYDSVLFKRSNDRVAPHNSYITYENIAKGADTVKATLAVPEPDKYLFFLDSDKQLTLGSVVEEFTVNYNDNSYSPTYTYDAEKLQYFRTVKENITKDNATGAMLMLRNILVLEANHSYEANSSSLRVIDLNSGGKGYLFQNGVKIAIDWNNINGKLTVFANDLELKLGVGKTWVNIVPDLSAVS